ncbi:MAG: ATP-binding cassette domain-containing protein [Cryobacterium sp.]
MTRPANTLNSEPERSREARPGSGTPMVSVRDLSHRYPDGTQALSDITLNVDRGEAVVLLGHNASGKSTLLKALTRLVEPTTGVISVGGSPVTGASARGLRSVRRGVGTVFQSINLVDQVSVLSNVVQGGLGRTRNPRHWFGWTAPTETRDEAMQCLQRVGLAPFASRRADQLSGGQRQRVAIARMLMQRPALVLADEPVAALDPRAGREVMDLLWQIVAEENLTLVCTLHQLELAELYGDRIVALQQGSLVLDGRMRDLSRNDLAALYTHETDDLRSHGTGLTDSGLTDSGLTDTGRNPLGARS